MMNLDPRLVTVRRRNQSDDRPERRPRARIAGDGFEIDVPIDAAADVDRALDRLRAGPIRVMCD